MHSGLHMSSLQVRRLSPHARLPSRATHGSAGYDLCSIEDKVLLAGDRALVRTGLALGVPSGTYGRLAPRSRLALRNGISIGAGVCDADYTGEVSVVLFNHGADKFIIHSGDRIAQLIIERIDLPDVREVDDLPTTARGAAGWGSTGLEAHRAT